MGRDWPGPMPWSSGFILRTMGSPKDLKEGRNCQICIPEKIIWQKNGSEQSQDQKRERSEKAIATCPKSGWESGVGGEAWILQEFLYMTSPTLPFYPNSELETGLLLIMPSSYIHNSFRVIIFTIRCICYVTFYSPNQIVPSWWLGLWLIHLYFPSMTLIIVSYK